MRVLVILSILSAVTLASGRRLIAVKRRRESKWDIIHHEYHGPPAPLSKDGRVIDTAEVAEAKANHLAIHAETAADLARKMAEANAEEAKLKAEASPEAAPIVVAEPVQMTPELMAMLMAAAAEEQKQEEEPKQAEEAAAPEAAAPEAAAPEAAAPEPEAPKEEVAPAPVSEASAEPEAAAEQPAAQEQPAAAEAPTAAEASKEAEAQAPAAAESEATNEVESSHPKYVLMRSYEGPLAPLDHIGRVIETPEVKKAREDHFAAYRQAMELAKAKEEQWKEENAEQKEETKEKIQYIQSPPIVHLLYKHSPIGYKGPEAPIGKNGRVVDTEEVERAKEAHKRALAHAEAIAKRHPPKPEDNLI